MNTRRHSWRSRLGRASRIHQFLLGLIAAMLLAGVVAYVRTVVPTASPSLAIDVGTDRHPISPDIYGMNDYSMNAADVTLLKELRLTVHRWGGNHTTRYNWKINSSNAGDDWYFTGGPGSNGTADPRSGAPSYVDQLIDKDRINKTKSVITVPMIGYVSKNRDALCGFSVAKYGRQQATNPYEPDCGNGKKPDGTTITGNDPLDTSLVINQTFVQDWIKHLTQRYGTAAQGGVTFYELDNEPSGWKNTHRDLYPQALSYDELRDRTYQYAPAIKATDPSAKTLGPSDFGWAVYVNSEVSGDREAHGGVWFAEWYLQQMKAYEQQHGVRILDYFDEHYYPAQTGVANAPAGDTNTQALRLRSTRSLWDPTYKDEGTWIGRYYPPLQLIPRFHRWVNKHYPGTKVAITEYNWGGLESINGALAQADVLGIFGREQLDLATLWGPPTPTQPGAYAFRMYRNYDDQGSAYGDTWVRSTSSDQGRLAIYGAQRSRDGAVTLMIINKTGKDLTSGLALKKFNPAAQAQVYTYSAANLSAVVRQPDQAVSATGFSAMYPANSITLVVIPTGSAT